MAITMLSATVALASTFSASAEDTEDTTAYAYDKAITFSGLSLNGTPTISEFPTPDTGTDTTAVALNWDFNYKKEYGGTPTKLLFSTDNGVTDKYKKNNSGWMRYAPASTTKPWQTSFFYDRDAFN